MVQNTQNVRRKWNVTFKLKFFPKIQFFFENHEKISKIAKNVPKNSKKSKVLMQIQLERKSLYKSHYKEILTPLFPKKI